MNEMSSNMPTMLRLRHTLNEPVHETVCGTYHSMTLRHNDSGVSVERNQQVRQYLKRHAPSAKGQVDVAPDTVVHVVGHEVVAH